MKKEKLYFDKNGFCIYKNIFTPDQISTFRILVQNSLDEDLKSGRAEYFKSANKKVYYTKGDILTKPLSALLLNNKIVNIAKEILGTTPSYFGEGNYQVGVGDRGFHRDMVHEIKDGKSTRIFGHGPDWHDDYNLIRVGVYLQDHDKCSGGVKFEKGSNKLPYNKGERVLADTKAGDVVVWDLRTFHSGNSVRLKLFPNCPLGYRIENFIPEFLTIPETKERNSAFMVFGENNNHLKRHIEKHYKLKFKEHIKSSIYNQDIVKNCSNAGINFINVSL